MFRNAMHTLNYLSLRYRQRGLTTLEYAIAGSIIAAGVVALFIAIGGKVNNQMGSINTNLTGSGF